MHSVTLSTDSPLNHKLSLLLITNIHSLHVFRAGTIP